LLPNHAKAGGYSVNNVFLLLGVHPQGINNGMDYLMQKRVRHGVGLLCFANVNGLVRRHTPTPCLLGFRDEFAAEFNFPGEV
jgi:hypothetical protein